MGAAGTVDPQIANAGFVTAAVIFYTVAILLFAFAMFYMARHWTSVFRPRRAPLADKEHE